LTLKKATAYRNKEIYFMNFVFTNGMGNFISTGTMNWRAGHEKKKRALAGAASSSAEAGLQKESFAKFIACFFRSKERVRAMDGIASAFFFWHNRHRR